MSNMYDKLREDSLYVDEECMKSTVHIIIITRTLMEVSIWKELEE